MPDKNGWSTIDSAPRDGRPIHLFVPERFDLAYTITAFWSEDKLLAGGGGWFDAESASSSIWETPTHWHPLLEPPEGTSR